MSIDSVKKKRRFVVIPVEPDSINLDKMKPETKTNISSSNNQTPPANVPPSVAPKGPPTAPPSVVSGPPTAPPTGAPRGPPTAPPAGLPPPPPSSMNNELSQIKLAKPSGSPGLPPPPPKTGGGMADMMSEIKERLKSGTGLTPIGAKSTTTDKNAANSETGKSLDTQDPEILQLEELLKKDTIGAMDRDAMTILLNHYATNGTVEDYTPKKHELHVKFLVNLINKEYVDSTLEKDPMSAMKDEKKFSNIYTFLQSKLEEYFVYAHEFGMTGTFDKHSNLYKSLIEKYTKSKTESEGKNEKTSEQTIEDKDFSATRSRIETAFIAAFMKNLEVLYTEKNEDTTNGKDTKTKGPKQVDAGYEGKEGMATNKAPSTDPAMITAVINAILDRQTKAAGSGISDEFASAVMNKLDAYASDIELINGKIDSLSMLTGDRIEQPSFESQLDLENKLNGYDFSNFYIASFKLIKDQNNKNVMPPEIFEKLGKSNIRLLAELNSYYRLLEKADYKKPDETIIKQESPTYLALQLIFRQYETGIKGDLSINKLKVYYKKAIQSRAIKNIPSEMESREQFLNTYAMLMAHHVSTLVSVPELVRPEPANNVNKENISNEITEELKQKFNKK